MTSSDTIHIYRDARGFFVYTGEHTVFFAVHVSGDGISWWNLTLEDDVWHTSVLYALDAMDFTP